MGVRMEWSEIDGVVGGTNHQLGHFGAPMMPLGAHTMAHAL